MIRIYLTITILLSTCTSHVAAMTPTNRAAARAARRAASHTLKTEIPAVRKLLRALFQTLHLD